MTMAFQLFQLFFKLSLLCFGGGYVMIPIMMEAVQQNEWASAQHITDIVAIAALSPGPVAMNAAVGLGYHIYGIVGMAAAFFGILIPCILVVVLTAAYFLKWHTHPAVQGILWGLRAVIPGVIFVAALNMAMENGMLFSGHSLKDGINIVISGWNFEIKSIGIMVLTIVLLLKTKIHPVVLIIASAFAGILLF